MYYVLKLDGQVVNIVRCDVPDVNVCLPLVEGKCDTIQRAANLESLIGVLKTEQEPEPVTGDNHVDRIVRNVTDKAEKFVNDLCDRLVKAKKGDIQSIVDRAKSAGQTLLNEMREQQKKAAAKAKKKE